MCIPDGLACRTGDRWCRWNFGNSVYRALPETLKAVGPFYLVSMPGEVKDPKQGVNV